MAGDRTKSDAVWVVKQIRNAKSAEFSLFQFSITNSHYKRLAAKNRYILRFESHQLSDCSRSLPNLLQRRENKKTAGVRKFEIERDHISNQLSGE